MKNIMTSLLITAMAMHFSSCCFFTQSCGCKNGEAKNFCLEGENLAWAHYETSDTFDLVNGIGDVQTLRVTSKTAIKHYRDRGDECVSDQFDAVRYDINFQGRLLMSVEIGGSGEVRYFSTMDGQIGTCSITLQQCWEDNLVEFAGEFQESLMINGREFNDVFSIAIPSSFSEIDWSRDEGIIRLKIDTDEWNLIL